MQVALTVEGQPNFYPDHLDIGAPPPPGTTVEIGEQRFAVRELVLRVRPALPEGYRAYYVARLIPADLT